MLQTPLLYAIYIMEIYFESINGINNQRVCMLKNTTINNVINDVMICRKITMFKYLLNCFFEKVSSMPAKICICR